MQFKNYILTFLVITTLVSRAIYADDTIATVASGGIEFKKSSDISMEKEILKINKNKVDIYYEFYNQSNKKIDATVLFPLPLSPFGSLNNKYKDSEDSFSCAEYDKKAYGTLCPFLEFKAFSNGKEIKYEKSYQAINSNGENITKLLEKNNIPLSPVSIVGYQDNGLQDLNPELKVKLKKLNLVDENSYPTWKNFIYFYWKQTFLPKKTLVSQENYPPKTGYHWLKTIKEGDNSFKNLGVSIGRKKLRYLSEYCPTEQQKKDILNLVQTHSKNGVLDQYLNVAQVQYVLQTGANWKGPIKKFRLEVSLADSKPKKGVILFCWPGKIFEEDGKLISDLLNFTPEKDLDILFIY